VPHDDIHLAVKYGKQPIYETMKRDLTKATVDRDLFEKADRLTQVWLGCAESVLWLAAASVR
jgi:hypothetical protein